MKTLRIASRKSRLAQWQANHVKQLLLQRHKNLNIELVLLTTQGDREQQASLIDIGGKALFVKELQQALLDERADIAVHSMKDMSVHPHPDLTLAAICEREDARDVFVGNRYTSLNELPSGAVIGTASPRRQSLLKNLRPDIEIKLLRGNVDTRLKKIEGGEYDATILAAAGLHRLEFQNVIGEYFDPAAFVPAIAQGALGIECRSIDNDTTERIKPLNHIDSALCIEAERNVNRILKGDCHTPIGVHATLTDSHIQLYGVVGDLSGKQLIRSEIRGARNDATLLSEQLADDLLKQGADKLIDDE